MKVAVWALAVMGLVGAGVANGETFVVNKLGDDGSPHTLRWAIEQANASSKPNNRVQVAPTSQGSQPFVIKLDSVLPPIKGPVVVEAISNRVSVVVDGSNFIDGNNTSSCPATPPGTGFGPNVRSVFGPGFAVVDSGNVEITGFEIQNFCIGILSLRSHDNHFHDNTIHNTSGAAGILITGDDGTAAGGSTSGLSTRNLIEYNTIYETGDGMECTRGTTFTTYQFNKMTENRDRPNVPFSQGIECAGSLNDHISILNNTITGYSDGLQLNSATNLVVSGNTITGTTYGATAGGQGVFQGNTITGNRMGIGPSNTSDITITQNKIFNNG